MIYLDQQTQFNPTTLVIKQLTDQLHCKCDGEF